MYEFSMMLRRSLWVFCLITLVTLSGCEFKDVELEEVESFEVKSFQGGQLDGVISLRLTNPNFYSITVKEGEFDVSMGPAKLGTAKLKDSFKINGNTTEIYDVNIEGKFGNMLAAGLTGLAGFLSGEDPELLIKGQLKVGNLLVTKRVFIEERSNVPIEFN